VTGLAGTRVNLDHVGIMVPDMNEAVAWYTSKLGFALRDRWANDAIGMEWAHLELGNFVIEFVTRPGLTAPTESAFGIHHIAIEVDDCATTVAMLEATGVPVMFAPSYFERHDMDWAFVTDHLGNVFEIVSYRAAGGAHD